MSTTDDKAEAPKAKSIATLSGGAKIQPIVPTTVGEIFRLGESIFQSGLAPDSMKTAQQVTIVMMKGMEIGLPPMAALESLGVIKGKVAIYGDGIPALLWAHGFEIEDGYYQKGGKEGLDYCVATCKITRPNGKTFSFEYGASDAKENGLWDIREKNHKGEPNSSPWFKYKRRMLRMRCRGWLARDVAADVLKGIPVYEEVEDMNRGMRDVTPAIPMEIPDEIPEAVVVSEAEDTQEPVITDADKYVSDLETTLMNAAEDSQNDFDQAWTSHLDDFDGKLSRADQEKAKAAHDRVKAKYFPEPEKPAAKGKKKSPPKGGTPSLI